MFYEQRSERITSQLLIVLACVFACASWTTSVAAQELEKSANALQSEVDALRTEKAALEEKAATYEAQAGYKIPPGVTGV